MQSAIENEYAITPGSLVKGVTWFVIFIFASLGTIIPFTVAYFENNTVVAILLGLLLISIFITILVGTWAYSPEKYLVSDNGIRIIRPISSFEIPIKKIKKIEDKNPDTFKIWKTMGNGGLFSLSGSFYNKEDGKFWMYAKNNNYVMIHTQDKKLVLSPDEKEQFMIELKNKIDRIKKL